MPRGIFISHITEEASIARVLKNWIESSFVDQCEVFVSSDQGDIPAGSRWLEKIKEALESAAALLVLCSPASLRRPWINFETGCAWIKDVPVLPLCHSGQRKGSLPAPISTFQALEMGAPSFTEDILSAVAKHLGLSKIPRVNHPEMAAELASAIAKVSSVPSEPAQTASTQENDLSKECVEVMCTIASSVEPPTVTTLARRHKVSEEKMKYYLDILTTKKMAHHRIVRYKPMTYHLSQRGRATLVKKGLL